jgi:hypothetical protein
MASEFGVARMVFRAFLPSLIRQGLSSNAIINWAIKEGLSYRRQDMQATIRSFQGLYKLEGIVSKLDRNEPAPRYSMVETELPRASKYYIRGTVTYYDEATGQSWQKTISFYTDENINPNLWEKEFMDAQVENPSEPVAVILGVDFRSFEHNRGWEY